MILCPDKGNVMARGAGIAGFALMALVCLSAPALAQGPGYEVVARDPNMLELRFHNVMLRGVHADDSQNALSLDFQGPVDGGVFDRLPGDLPQWIGMAYASFDNGVIRASRPVTFLTRAEPDGFSLRIVARAPGGQPQFAQAPPPMRGQVQEYGPPPGYPPAPGYAAYGQPGGMPGTPGSQSAPPPPRFHSYDDYAGVRAYENMELAVRPADPMWDLVYGRAAMLSDSATRTSGGANWFHGGDRMITADVTGKYTAPFTPGIALVGDAIFTDVRGENTRAPDGTIVTTAVTDIFTGRGGLAFELGRDSEVRLEAEGGNKVLGAALTAYGGDPNGWVLLTADYHAPDLTTPTAVFSRADKDQVTLAGGELLGWNVWGSLAGHYTRYGILGDDDVAKTAGWDGSLRWTTAVYGGLSAGIAYDGHGEYRLTYDTRTGTAPTPYVPLGIRNMENHAATLTLTGSVVQGFWFDGYAGYVIDRYASDGLMAGLALHYTPVPGLDFALNLRHSAVSYVQGETGREDTAGLDMTLGFGDPPQPSWEMNTL